MSKLGERAALKVTTALVVGAGLALGLLGSSASAAEATKPAALPPPASLDKHWNMFDQYCVKCHNFTDWAGKVAFDTLTPDQVPENQNIFETAIRKLRGGLMPPPGNPHPPREEIDSFTASLATYLDDVSAQEGPAPGHVGLHRLNRAEYANAIRDLLGVKVDASALLPPDNTQDGYDNMAAVLQVSPSFLEQYVSAAHTVATMAVGNPTANPGSATYINERTDSFKRHVEGLPLGTRGGMVAEHDFPADGEYMINVADMAQSLWNYNSEFKNTVLVTLDGAEIYRTTLGGEADQKASDQNGVSAVDKMNERLKNIRFKTTAGEHEVGVTFLARTFAESDNQLESLVPGGGQERVYRVGSFEIRGPFNPTGVSETPSRRLIFACYPEAQAEMTPCAKEIVSRFAQRAFRRPVTDSDMADLMKFYDAGKAQGGFDDGIRMALTAVLASPDFLYRTATAPANTAPGSIYKVSDIDLASELSFFLWSSVPDDELLTAAEQGKLHDPAVLKSEVMRMLADKRSKSLVTEFAFHWLDMSRLNEIEPDSKLFPQASNGGNRGEGSDPRPAYLDELKLFIDSILHQDKPVLDLLTADYTFLNERVASLYGIEDVKGDQFRRVTLKDPARFGLLGKGAVLLATSDPNRTAPVLRGKFILENFLGAPPNPPPGDVKTDLPEAKPGEKKHTVRELMALHRTKKTCNMCHGVMDPLGLALENFDAIGEWRSKDRFAGTVIDASGQLPDGTQLNGPTDVRAALMREPQLFVQTFTEELMKFALGRTLTYHDMPTVRTIVREAGKDNYRFSSIVLGIVKSDAFQMRRMPEAPKGPAVKQASAED
jgi:hypothetical protein